MYHFLSVKNFSPSGDELLGMDTLPHFLFHRRSSDFGRKFFHNQISVAKTSVGNNFFIYPILSQKRYIKEQKNLRKKLRRLRPFPLLNLNTWWAHQDLNLEPPGYEPAALPLSYGPSSEKQPTRILGYFILIHATGQLLTACSTDSLPSSQITFATPRDESSEKTSGAICTHSPQPIHLSESKVTSISISPSMT